MAPQLRMIFLTGDRLHANGIGLPIKTASGYVCDTVGDSPKRFENSVVMWLWLLKPHSIAMFEIACSVFANSFFCPCQTTTNYPRMRRLSDRCSK